MKIIYLNGFEPREKVHYRSQVFSNLCTAICRCLDVMADWEWSLDDASNTVSWKERKGSRPGIIDPIGSFPAIPAPVF
jgi:hypothetical protein